jgi:hypothetical protein
MKGGVTMATWTNEELEKIGATEELQIAALRSDSTLRKPVTIWVVRLGENIYVRSVNGRNSTWFRGVQIKHEGHIRVGSIEKEVTFEEETAQNINDQIDEAYRTKYRRYAATIIDHINSTEARASTIKLVGVL